MLINNIYDYPVMLEPEVFANATGRKLLEELDGNNVGRVYAFLATVHSHIYDFLIYTTGSKSIKDRIIKKYKDELKNPILRALISQAQYLLTDGNNIGLWNGVVSTVNGITVTNTQDVINKVLCPEVVNILLSTEPNGLLLICNYVCGLTEKELL